LGQEERESPKAQRTKPTYFVESPAKGKKKKKNYRDAVKDHCHIKGKYRGAAHNDCNLKLHIKPKNGANTKDLSQLEGI